MQRRSPSDFGSESCRAESLDKPSFSLDLSKAKKDSGESTNGSIDFESVSEPRQAERKTSAHQDEDGEIVILTKPTNNTKPIDRKPPKRQPAPSTSHISTKTKGPVLVLISQRLKRDILRQVKAGGLRIVDMKPEERPTGLLPEGLLFLPEPGLQHLNYFQLTGYPPTKQQCLDHFDVMRQKLKEILRLIKHYIAAWNDLAHQAILPASQWQLIKRGNESELKRWSDKHSSTVELFCEWYCKSLGLPQVQHHHEQEGLKWGIGPAFQFRLISPFDRLPL
ncbi:hypothetical protein KEM48_010887 [Puccinia striiformis f. sp. tritici PST-130]|nr:hypothetical protein KEM48_010887 [Puccinia striiformis f. sp. tritici PST-130]